MTLSPLRGWLTAFLCLVGLWTTGCSRSDQTSNATTPDSQPDVATAGLTPDGPSTTTSTPEDEAPAPEERSQQAPIAAVPEVEPAPPQPAAAPESVPFIGRQVIVRSPEVRPRLAPDDDSPEIDQSLEMDLLRVIAARGTWLRVLSGWLQPADVILVENPLEDLTAELKRYPSPANFTRRAAAWKEIGDLQKAEDDANSAVRLDPQSASSYCVRGEVRELLGKEGALRDFDQALELDPYCAAALAGRATAKVNRGDWNGAIDDVTMAIQLIPGQPWYYVTRCQARMSLYKFEEAELDATTAIELAPQFAAGYEYRAQISIIQQDFKKALRDCNEAIRLCDKKSIQGFLFRGTVLQKSGDYAGAIADYSEVIRISPESNLGYLLRGNVLLASRQYEKAIPDLTKAIEITPSSAEAFERRAHAYYMAGMHRQSERDRREALRLIALVREPVRLPPSVASSSGRFEPFTAGQSGQGRPGTRGNEHDIQFEAAREGPVMRR